MANFFSYFINPSLFAILDLSDLSTSVIWSRPELSSCTDTTKLLLLLLRLLLFFSSLDELDGVPIVLACSMRDSLLKAAPRK